MNDKRFVYMNEKKIKILFISVNRSDYGIWRPTLKLIKKKLPNCIIGIYTTAGHLASKSKFTIQEIYSDNFYHEIFEYPSTLDNDTPLGSTATISLVSSSLGFVINKFQPNMICILGDRYEALAAALTSSLFRIPIIHFHGGSITEGAIDDNFRHAISKLSHYHFVECEGHKNRIEQLGEDGSKIIISGAPSLNELKNFKSLSFDDFKNKFKLSTLKKFILVTLHSETTKTKAYNKIMAYNFFSALMSTGYDLLITSPNPDPFSEPIYEEIEKCLECNKTNFFYVPHLGHIGYFNAMNLCTFMAGNSSSGIIESSSFKKLVINVGQRQKNRSHNDNVIHCSEKFEDIQRGMEQIKTLLTKQNISDNWQNIYFNKDSENIIKSFFKEHKAFYQKSFVDHKFMRNVQ